MMGQPLVPQEVIIVEGRADTRRLKEIYGPQVKTLETNGSAMDPDRFLAMDRAQDQFGLIIFTDPDYPGLRIRRHLTQRYPLAKQAHLRPDQAQGQGRGRNLGVEYADDAAIIQALEEVLTPLEESKQTQTPISQAQLLSLGLVGRPQSGPLRQAVADHFGLGHVNAKQLRHRLTTYQVPLEEVRAFLQSYEEGFHDS